MSRPKDSDSEQVHRRLLAAAKQLLEAGGPRAVTLRKVASEAKLTVGTVSYYFGNREELLEAVLDEPYRALAALQQQLVSGVDAEKDSAAYIEHCVRTTYRFALDWKGAFRLNVLTILDRGIMHPRRQRTVHLPFLDFASLRFAGLTGIAPDQMRMIVQSTVFMVIRYALLHDDEVHDILALPPATSLGEAHRRIEDHLVTMVRRMALLPPG